MSWPLSHEFNEAIQNPHVAFADPDLKGGETVVGATGLPLPRSGNFADVYQVRGSDGREWAVKCFTRPVAGLAERYARVSAALAKANLPFTVGFTFLAEGIRVGGVWRPVVKMEWVEGLLLNQVARENAAKPAILSALGQMWVRLCKRLREAGIAHADVQHGNVLLVPGARQGAYGLKLIDYDGMYVPALANTPSGESGHPSYQHPARAATRAYSPDADRFPHLAIATALRGLGVIGPALWERYDNGDNVLFTEADYRVPAESKAMKELWHTGDPALRALVGRLAIACGKPIPQTPWLDQFAPDGEPAPLDPSAYKDAAAALGVPLPVPVPLPPDPVEVAPVPAPLPPVPAEPVVVAPASDWADVVNVDLVEEPAPTKKKGKPKPVEDEPAPTRTKRKPRSEAKAKSNSQVLILVGGGLFLLVGAVVAGVLLAGGKSKPTDTAQQKPEEPSGPSTKGPVTKPKDKAPEPVVVKPKEPAIDPVPIPNPVPGPKVPDRFGVRQAWSVDAPSITQIAVPPDLSSDGRTFVLPGAPAKPLLVVDAATGKDLAGSFDCPNGVKRMIPLKDGRFALTVVDGRQKTISVLEPRTGRSSTLPVPEVGAYVMQFVSPDAEYVAAGGAENIQDPQPFKLIRAGDGKTVLDFKWVRGHVFFTPDSSRVLVSESNGRCRWFKLPDGTPDGGWELRPGKIAWNERFVFAGSADGSVLIYEGSLTDRAGVYHVLNGRSGAVIRSIPGDYRVDGTAASADGGLLLVWKPGIGMLSAMEIVSTATGTVVAELFGGKHCAMLTGKLLPDGSGVLAAGVFIVPAGQAPFKILRFDFVGAVPKPKDPSPDAPAVPVALKARWHVPHDTDGAAATIHVRDQTILLGSARTSLGAIDLATGADRPKFGLIELTGGDSFCPLDGGRVAKYTPDDKDVRTWDVKTGKTGEKFPVPAIPPGAGNAKLKLAWLAPNGQYLVVARGAPAPGAHEAVPFQVISNDKTGKVLVDATWVGGSVHFTSDLARFLVAEYNGRFRWCAPAGDIGPQGWEYPPPANGKTHTVTDMTADGRVIGYNGPAKSATESGPCLVDGKSGDVLHRFGAGYAQRSPVALAASGRVAAVLREPADADATVDVVSVPRGTVLARATVPTKGGVPTFALSGDGAVLIVHDPKAGTLWRFDLP